MPDAPLVLDAHEKSASAVHFTRDNKHLVSAGADGVRVWSVPKLDPVRSLGPARAVHGLSFCADESRVAISAADGVRLLSFADGKELLFLEKQSHAALGPDGDHLVTISAKNELALFDTRDGRRRALPAVDKRHVALAFAASGLFLFVGGTGPIHRIALPDGAGDGVHVGHQIGVACLRPSPNPAILASTGFDGTLRFWTVVGGDEVTCVPLEEQGSLQIAFAPDGRSLALATDRAVLRMRAPDGNVIARHELPVRAHGVAISPDARLLACAAADGRVRVWRI